MPVTAAIDNETLDHLLSVVERCPNLGGIRPMSKPGTKPPDLAYSGASPIARRSCYKVSGTTGSVTRRRTASNEARQLCRSLASANNAAHSGKSAPQTCFATSWGGGAPTAPPVQFAAPRRMENLRDM